MGILSGLKNFGVDMDGDIYGDNKAKQQAEEEAQTAARLAAADEARKAAEAAKKKQDEEPSLLLARSYECPVCDRPFKSLGVKANRARMVNSDIDLRPVYEPVDMLKYAVIACPNCGYAALTRNFQNITTNQKKVVREKICGNFKPIRNNDAKTVYSYDDAMGRYQMAFATAMATVAKPSEKAYLCLSMSWLARGQRKSLADTDFDYIKKLDECKVAERELQRKALEGFIYARQTEDYPMCGNMDQYTVDYIIAAMYFKTREFESAMKLLPDILVSSSANRRVKEKARDLKDRILAIKASNKAPTEEEMPD